MAKIIFDAERVTIGELVQFEVGIDYIWLRDFLAKFVADDNGNFVPLEEGRAFINGLSYPDGLAVKTAFWKFMGGVKQSAVPPEILQS